MADLNGLNTRGTVYEEISVDADCQSLRAMVDLVGRNYEILHCFYN